MWRGVTQTLLSFDLNREKLAIRTDTECVRSWLTSNCTGHWPVSCWLAMKVSGALQRVLWRHCAGDEQ